MIPIKGSAPSPRRPVATIGLIGLNLAVFLLEISVAPETLRGIILEFGFVPADFWSALFEAPVSRIDAWLLPLVSSLFLHGGWTHLLGNMIFLWVFGDGVENRIGPFRFLALYLCVGIGASLVHGLAVPGTSTPTVGASGAIAGLLGAYLLMYPRSSIVILVPIVFWPLFFQVRTVFFLGIWFLQQFFFGAVSVVAQVTQETGGVAWWAHIGGFLVGLAITPLFKQGKPVPEPQRRPRLFPDRSPPPRR